jgi:hypothetical protein
MASSNFLSKLNWRLIIIHTIACGFFIYGFKWLVYLHDTDFWLRLEHVDLSHIPPERITANLHLQVYFAFAGLFTGFIISLLLSVKHKWFWLNSVLVLLASFTLMQLDLYGWGILKHVFELPGLIFKGHYAAYIITNAAVMILIGIIVFVMKPLTRFIEAGTVRK